MSQSSNELDLKQALIESLEEISKDSENSISECYNKKDYQNQKYHLGRKASVIELKLKLSQKGIEL